jgi:hypothetical protein
MPVPVPLATTATVARAAGIVTTVVLDDPPTPHPQAFVIVTMGQGAVIVAIEASAKHPQAVTVAVGWYVRVWMPPGQVKHTSMKVTGK